MASVRFAWNPTLVSLRREICPNARWQKARRAWTMTDQEAKNFVRAVQARLVFERSQAQIYVDDVGWVVGFVQGTPYRLIGADAK